MCFLCGGFAFIVSLFVSWNLRSSLSRSLSFFLAVSMSYTHARYSWNSCGTYALLNVEFIVNIRPACIASHVKRAKVLFFSNVIHHETFNIQDFQKHHQRFLHNIDDVYCKFFAYFTILLSHHSVCEIKTVAIEKRRIKNNK